MKRNAYKTILYGVVIGVVLCLVMCKVHNGKLSTETAKKRTYSKGQAIDRTVNSLRDCLHDPG